ncbi:MAG: CoA-binding protein [Syntrophales bacterium]|jgi:acyl-CoA synthetase (NDP forming)|nr:CoA-binding protein [Syntrophales bacterium]MCK9527396.1 CoA-binding protein [Syntrophales bacterium]MDX9921498.1 CoA-binding protein [Syntrophales bacterium]
MNLDRLFYPRSVAVIGASAGSGGGRIPYLQVLQLTGYQGSLYPVNPKYKEISCLPVYSSIDELPDGVDLTIVATPIHQSLDILRSAVRKKFKFIHFFTSGFGETGNRKLEDELVAEARRGGVRIIGPNCIGVHCTESRLSFGHMPQETSPGSVAFLAQSGGITSSFMSMALARKTWINKVVSYGNQADLTVEDYIEYFAQDPGIKLIACYIEDIKNHSRFLSVLRRTTATKPVIILKGGTTDHGSKAAASHTGAMASNNTIWAAAARQHGAILVDNLERMMSLVMLGTTDRVPAGNRVGFLGAGGGVAVLFADMAINAGLLMPELQAKTQERILERIRDVNTSTTNPVDLGAFGFDLAIMSHTMKALDDDEEIDIIIPYFSVDYIAQAEAILNVTNSEKTILEMAGDIKKPVIPILMRFTDDNLDIERIRISTYSTLREAGFPVFPNIQEAVYTLRSFFWWLDRRENIR